MCNSFALEHNAVHLIMCTTQISLGNACPSLSSPVSYWSRGLNSDPSGAVKKRTTKISVCIKWYISRPLKYLGSSIMQYILLCAPLESLWAMRARAWAAQSVIDPEVWDCCKIATHQGPSKKNYIQCCMYNGIYLGHSNLLIHRLRLLKDSGPSLQPKKNCIQVTRHRAV